MSRLVLSNTSLVYFERDLDALLYQRSPLRIANELRDCELFRLKYYVIAGESRKLFNIFEMTILCGGY